MSSRLFNLHCELRLSIYEYVLLSQGPVRIIPWDTRDWKLLGAEGWTAFSTHHPVEPKYPPPSIDGEPSEASNVAPFKHLPVRNDGAAHDPDLWQYGLSLQNGELVIGPNLVDGETYDDESDENEMKEEENNGGRARRPRYNMEPFSPLDLNLLLVNRQINSEATPVFYTGVTFVPNADAVDTLRFFKALPDRALHNITTITFLPEQLHRVDGPSRLCWTGEPFKPLTKGCPAMVTLVGASLATYMPKLSDVYLYTPINGDEDGYCSCAPIELCKLLCVGKIRRLHYVFMGEKVAEALRTTPDSQKCFERLFDDEYTPGKQAAKHEFALHHPMPLDSSERGEAEHQPSRQRLLVWWKQEEEYVKRHGKLIGWKWGGRDVHMGNWGRGQAVVTTWLK